MVSMVTECHHQMQHHGISAECVLSLITSQEERAVKDGFRREAGSFHKGDSPGERGSPLV